MARSFRLLFFFHAFLATHELPSCTGEFCDGSAPCTESLHMLQRKAAKGLGNLTNKVAQDGVAPYWQGVDATIFWSHNSTLTETEERRREQLCLPDFPGSMRNAGICMAASMGLMALIGYYLLHVASSSNEVAQGQRFIEARNQTSGTTERASAPLSNAATALTESAQIEQRPTATVATSGAVEARASTRIEAINGLRTVVVTYVILKHFPGGLPRWAIPMLVDGWSMQFFFVLSGFVLQSVTAAKHEMLDRSAAVKLILRRWVRLVPLYELAIVLCFIPKMIQNQLDAKPVGKPWAAWPMNALMLQGIVPLKVCGNDSDWSLNFIHFNANFIGWFTASLMWVTCCFPILYNNLPRVGVGKLSMLLGLIFACRATPEIFRPAWGCFNQNMSLPKEDCHGFMHLYSFAPLRVFEFAAGMLTMSLVTQASSRVQEICWGWVFDIAIIAAVAGVCLASQKFGFSALFSGDFLLTPLWCLVCATACLAARQKASFPVTAGPLYTALSSWPLAPLGQYSFEAYILHYALLQGGIVQRFPLNLIYVWFAAYIVEKIVQEPLVKAVNARLNRK